MPDCIGPSFANYLYQITYFTVNENHWKRMDIFFIGLYKEVGTGSPVHLHFFVYYLTHRLQIASIENH